ncbi:hypothetical protein C2S52_020716 [Perilla frutescens var. hirtella]|nr:hypothetical protein C2S52_020716 [Perilla frutescens var. hirtella]
MKRKLKKKEIDSSTKDSDENATNEATHMFKKVVKGKVKISSAEVSKSKKRKKCGNASPSDSGDSSRAKKKSVKKVLDTSAGCCKKYWVWGLLYFQEFRGVLWSYVYWFIEHFNPASRLVYFDNNDKFMVTPDDICDLFLLPRNEGMPVLKGRDGQFLKSVITDWIKKYSENNIVTVSGVRSLLLDSRLADGGEDFKQFFVIYVMSIFLAPTMNRSTNLNLIKLVVEVHLISSFDWCSYVLDKLCKGVVFLKKNLEKKNVIGCILVLPLLYLHRLKWKDFSVSSTLPLIRHWNASIFNKRFIEETKAGGFGHGEFVIGVYPVSHGASGASASCEGARFGDVRVDESGRYIRYLLSANEKNDAEIHHVSEDALQESFLLLKRDLNVVTRAHMDRLKELGKCFQERDRHQASSSSAHPMSQSDDFFGSDKFIALVDEVIDSFRAMQEDSKSCYPVFSSLRPQSPNVVLHEVSIDDMIDDVCKFSESLGAAGVGHEEGKNELKEADEEVMEEDIRRDDKCVDHGKSTVLRDVDADVAVVDEVFYSVGRHGSQHFDYDPIDPWFVGDDEWSVDESFSFQSIFMKKNERRYLKELSLKQKYVVDYFFHNHRSVVDYNVFACRNNFFLSFSLMQSLQDSCYVHITIIDTWALLLDQFEKHHARIDERNQLKLYCTAQQSACLNDVMKLKREMERQNSDVDEEILDIFQVKRAALRGCWNYSMEQMGSLGGVMTAEVLYFPIYSSGHFFLVVINFRECSVQYLDNIKRTSVEDCVFWQLSTVLQEEFAEYLEEVKHPKASELKGYPLVNVEFEWQKNSGGFDCGVFVMNHMENFDGKVYSCPDLMNLCGRRKLRALYCARIVLAGTNDLRFEVHKSVLEFMKRKKK